MCCFRFPHRSSPFLGHPSSLLGGPVFGVHYTRKTSSAGRREAKCIVGGGRPPGIGARDRSRVLLYLGWEIGTSHAYFSTRIPRIRRGPVAAAPVSRLANESEARPPHLVPLSGAVHVEEGSGGSDATAWVHVGIRGSNRPPTKKAKVGPQNVFDKSFPLLCRAQRGGDDE